MIKEMKKIATLFFVFSLMLTSFTAGAQPLRGDVNLDGNVSIGDVTTLIDYLLTGQWPEANHEWVDLGLPSGTLWATCNVGACAPEEYGDYFAWGETEPKDVYNWDTYKWCYGGCSVCLTKYCTDSENGHVDNKTELDPEDDAACVNWGPSWRMPTLGQFLELYDNCTSQWTTRNGVNGYLLTGPNGKTLFLPAAGYRSDGSLYYAGSRGAYWLPTLDTVIMWDYPYDGYAYNLSFSDDDEGFYSEPECSRSLGFTVRAVRVP